MFWTSTPPSYAGFWWLAAPQRSMLDAFPLALPSTPTPTLTLLAVSALSTVLCLWETDFYRRFPWICSLSASWLTFPVGGTGRLSEREESELEALAPAAPWLPWIDPTLLPAHSPCLMAVPHSSWLWIPLHCLECVWLPPPSRLICTCVLSCLCRVQLFATLWTVDCQAPLTMGFSQQEY